jgi:tRNA splicing endonuclease
MQFYVNDLFVFEPKTKAFYSHEEFIYQLYKDLIKDPTISLSDIYYNKLFPAQEYQKDEEEKMNAIRTEIIQSSEDFSFEKALSNINKMVKSTDEEDWTKDTNKHNFELFLKIVNLGEYKFEISVKAFLQGYLKSLGTNEAGFIVYVYLRQKGFEIESGSIFGFDFLLYKESQEEVGLLNKTNRTHSDFAVFIHNHDSNIQYTFLDIQRKHRIAQNYKKVK